MTESKLTPEILADALSFGHANRADILRVATMALAHGADDIHNALCLAVARHPEEWADRAEMMSWACGGELKSHRGPFFAAHKILRFCEEAQGNARYVGFDAIDHWLPLIEAELKLPK